MFKKIVLLLFVLFSLCGCEAVYNLDIDDKYIETFYINNYDVNSWENTNPSYKKLIEINQSSYTPVNTNYFDEEVSTKENGKEYYKKELIRTNKNLGVKYSYSFNKSDYTNSTISHYGFNNFNSTDNTIYASKINDIFERYPSLEKLVINVNTLNKKVLENNADKQSGSVYTWEFNKTNNSGKTIKIKYDKKEEVTSSNEENGSSNHIVLYVILGAIIIIGFYIFVKVKKSNN